MRTAAIITTVAALVAPAFSFVSPSKPLSPATSKGRSSVVRMVAVDDIGSGVSAPTGYFDPLGLSSNQDKGSIRKFREAELKHGRVAMLAAVGILVQEKFHPLFGFGEREMGPAIYHFQQIQNLYPFFWTGLLFTIGVAESRAIARNWQPPEDVNPGGIATVRDDIITGDLGYDPFGVAKDPEQFKSMRTKELNNGRLAMIAVAGMVAQELKTGLPLFAQVPEQIPS